jgi:hypothetical protein
VVSPPSFERMTTPVVADPETGDRYGYGVKWMERDGRRLLGHSGGMIGFSSYLLVDPDVGVGAAVLCNSVMARKLELVVFALACLRAEGSGAALPEVPEPPDPFHVERAEVYGGTYVDGSGPVQVIAEDPGLSIEMGGRRARLAATDASHVFAVDDAELERFPIRFLHEGETVTGAFWGPRWLVRGGQDRGIEPEHPALWSAIAGRYASWNPWFPGFRVFLRRGELWLAFTGEASDVDGERLLWPLPDGSFRVGESWSPHRVRFDMVVEGTARRAVFDAAPLYRRFSE